MSMQQPWTLSKCSSQHDRAGGFPKASNLRVCKAAKVNYDIWERSLAGFTVLRRLHVPLAALILKQPALTLFVRCSHSDDPPQTGLSAALLLHRTQHQRLL